MRVERGGRGEGRKGEGRMVDCTRCISDGSGEEGVKVVED